MAYALHRRAAFRRDVVSTGWNFDLTKSSYLEAATLLDRSTSQIGGTAVTPRRLFLPSDSSFLLELDGAVTRRYDFPADHFGDIYYLQNAHYTTYKITQFSAHPTAYSLDGLHYVRQGHGSNNSSNNWNVYSCPLDSYFDFNSIPADEAMSVLSEFTGYYAGLAFSSDGLYLLVLGSGTIRSYYLSNPFDVSSASMVYTQVSLTRFTNTCGIARVVALPNNFHDWQFSPDGFTLVALWSQMGSSSDAGGVFFVFKLSAPFNISTISLDHVWDIKNTLINGFTIDHGGQNLYVARSTTLLQYALSA